MTRFNALAAFLHNLNIISLLSYIHTYSVLDCGSPGGAYENACSVYPSSCVDVVVYIDQIPKHSNDLLNVRLLQG